MNKDYENFKRNYGKLSKLNLAFKDINPIEYENKYFQELNAFDEKSKILVELEYVRRKIKQEYREFGNREKYVKINNYLNLAQLTIEKEDVSQRQIDTIKKALVGIEMENNYTIHFYSELANFLDDDEKPQLKR